MDTDEGYNECYDICEPSLCCTAQGDDSCLAENPVICFEYLPCAVLAVTGGELEHPPDNIVSVCNLPIVLIHRAECRCICEDAACCIAEDDNNCFYKSNAEACTKWILSCAVLVFGNGADNVSCNGGGNRTEPEAFEVIDPEDLVFLASDDLEGRDNLSPGSNIAQEYLINQLEPIAVGLNFGLNGSDAFKQSFCKGTNILVIIEGSELPNEYAILGAHYDHIDTIWCSSAQAATSTICNGATDNAAGVAVVLGIGRSIAKHPTRPKRSLVLAFWDAEEDGLLGSAHYANNPLVPLNSTVAYLNWETLGLNLLPSLRNVSFAIGAETGGNELQNALTRSIADEGLGMRPVSLLFGLDRSDHTIFADVNIPTVMFSDATGGCYHTTGDEIGVVNFPKLEKEARIGLKLTLDLANTASPPNFETGLEVTFDDAVAISDLMNGIDADLNLFSLSDQVLTKAAQFLMIAIVAGGSDSFALAQMVTT